MSIHNLIRLYQTACQQKSPAVKLSPILLYGNIVAAICPGDISRSIFPPVIPDGISVESCNRSGTLITIASLKQFQTLSLLLVRDPWPCNGRFLFHNSLPFEIGPSYLELILYPVWEIISYQYSHHRHPQFLLCNYQMHQEK